MSYLLVVLLLGSLILAHELGHFLAARWMGIPVERFSIGFGPRLWGFRRSETDYWLSALPLGGYVLPRIGDEQDWFRVPLARRLAFSLGGPLANIALAVPLFATLAIMRGDVTFQAALVAPFVQTGQMLVQIVAALAMIFQRPDALTGVLGMVGVGGEYVGLDLARATRFTILISLNLAVFNLLPLPPLDGGKIVFDVLERLLPRARRAYVPVMVAGWLAMLGLMLYTTVLDVARLWA